MPPDPVAPPGPPVPPPGLVKAHQFPVPHLRLPWTDGPVPADLAALAEQQAAAASREVMRLRADLAGGRSARYVAAALEAVYRRLVEWRHDLAVEVHHLDPDAPPPHWFLATMDATDVAGAARYGAIFPVTGEPGAAARTSLAVDALIRTRHEAPESPWQRPDRSSLRNLVALPDEETVPTNALLLGGPDTWSFAPGARGPVPTSRDPYDPAYAQTSVVVPAPAEIQQRLHTDALHLIAELLVEPETTHVPRRFAHATQLLYHAPMYRYGSDDVIRTFLATVAHLLFAAPVVLPQDVDAQAQVRPQEDLPGVQGFTNWFADQLPPPLPRRQRNRRLGPPDGPDGPPVTRSNIPAALVTGRPATAAPTPPPPPRRRQRAAPAGGAAAPDSGGGAGASDLALLGQLMYAMYGMQQLMQSLPPDAGPDDDDLDVIESWF